MAWYDWFANGYDSLQALYADARESAADALELEGARRVLDVPTGTGQSLDALVARLGAGASVLGVDLSGWTSRRGCSPERGGAPSRRVSRTASSCGPVGGALVLATGVKSLAG